MSRTTTPETQAIFDFLDKHGDMPYSEASKLITVERPKYDVTKNTWKKRNESKPKARRVMKKVAAKKVGRPSKAAVAAAQRSVGRPRATAPAATGIEASMAWVRANGGNVARAKAFIAEGNKHIAVVEAALTQLRAVA